MHDGEPFPIRPRCRFAGNESRLFRHPLGSHFVILAKGVHVTGCLEFDGNDLQGNMLIFAPHLEGTERKEK